MEFQVTSQGQPGGLAFRRLSLTSVDAAAKLCDRCVGKNLYPYTYLASVLENPEHFFYLLVTAEEEAVGYIYFFLTGLEEMAALSKLPRERLAMISEREAPVIGNLQSIGVTEAWRRHGLSEQLVGFYLEQLQQCLLADAAFGVFWKPEGHVPMEKTLKAFGFRHLEDAHRVWYDKEDLICPYCRGRCACDGAVYYKPIRKEATK